MRSTSVWLATAVIGLALVAPAFAADAPATAPSTATKTIHTRQLAGEVVSVDQAAKTLTVKRGSSKTAKDMTFTVENDAAAALADLKAGDHVKVGYVASQGHLMAKTVAKNDNVAKK